LRLQLRAAALLMLVALPARADDRVDTTVTWMSERRVEGGSLTVVHPQFDLGLDLGENFSLSAGYEADVVSGATSRLYTASQGVDAISTATEFDDFRQVGRAGLSLQGRRSRLFAGYSYGTERDYRSHVVSAGGSVDLPGKNTTFAVSYSHNFDQVCDKNNGDATPLERRPLSGEDPCFEDADDPMRPPGEPVPTLARDVAIDTVEASLTQNVSPTMVLQLGAHGQILSGFQSNPYRSVRVGENEAQEHTPDERARLAVFVRTNLAFPRAHGALSVSLRGYTDTWGVQSGAAEMAYHQYLGKAVVFRLRTRVYQQTEAVFFEDAIDYANFGSTGEYFTGDRELSPLRNELVGGKMSIISAADDSGSVWGLFDELDFHVRADAMWAQSLTDTAPGGDPDGVLPDVLVVSVGLLLRY
jgi:hypothetical protein